MHSRTIVRPTRFPFTRFLLAAGFAGTILSGGLAYSRIAAALSHPVGARMNSAQVEQRMLTLCNQYEGPCEVISPPFYQDVTHLEFPPYNLHRKVWQGMLHSNGHCLHMILNDATGNLGAMYYGGEAAKTTNRQKQEPSVTSPVEAARLSLYYLRTLDIVPAHSEVALSGRPETVRSHAQWWIYWKIRRAPGAPSTTIRATISGNDGRLLTAVDRFQMGQMP